MLVPRARLPAGALLALVSQLICSLIENRWERAHPDLNQGPADLQSAVLTTELCTPAISLAHASTSAAGGAKHVGPSFRYIGTYGAG